MSAETPQADMAERITAYVASLRRLGLLIGMPKALPIVLDLDVWVGRPADHFEVVRRTSNRGGYRKDLSQFQVTLDGHRTQLPAHAFEEAARLELQAATLIADDGRLRVIRTDRRLQWSPGEESRVWFDFRDITEPRTTEAT